MYIKPHCILWVSYLLFYTFHILLLQLHSGWFLLTFCDSLILSLPVSNLSLNLSPVFLILVITFFSFRISSQLFSLKITMSCYIASKSLIIILSSGFTSISIAEHLNFFPQSEHNIPTI